MFLQKPTPTMVPPLKSLEAEIIPDPLKSYIKLYYWSCIFGNKLTACLYTVLLVYNIGSSDFSYKISNTCREKNYYNFFLRQRRCICNKLTTCLYTVLLVYNIGSSDFTYKISKYSCHIGVVSLVIN